MRTLFLCLSLCLAVGASFGAYQYIIFVDPQLATNPSNAVTVSVGTVNAQTASKLVMTSALETRYRTFTSSAAWGSEFYRTRVDFRLIIR
ncbi:MAG: hypothetical protein IKF72_07180 [Kiritimatiellae bacterium]|nr:hypothetical protein [Kiritimatiellia bacterium]